MFALAVSTGCSDSGGGAVQRVERADSAGVEIVTSHAPSWSEETAWRLSERPRVDIGRADGAPVEQLFQVRDVLRLADGRIVVANSGTHEVRFYGPDGGFLTSVGAEGDGPGEYQRVQSMIQGADDSLLIWDVGARRVSVLDRDGAFTRTFRLEPPPGFQFASLRGRLAGETLLASVSTSPDLTDLADSRGAQQFDLFLWTYETSGTPGRQILRFASDPRVIDVTRDGAEITSISIWDAPLGSGDRIAVQEGRIYATSADYRGVRRLDADGGLEGIYRIASPPQRVTAEMYDRWVADRVGLQTDPERARELRDVYAKVDPPARVPPQAALIADAECNAWLQRYPLPGDRETTTWWVISDSGEWLGEAEMPSGFEPYQIGPDFVLGTWTDELETEHVQLYELIRP